MSILVIAPHADDETLGMGASIARFIEEGRKVTVAILTGPGTEPHPIWPHHVWEKTRSEAVEAMKVLGVTDLLFENLPAACLSEVPTHRVNKVVSRIIAQVDPEELYLPFYHDLHHDHRALCYAALVHSRAYLEQGKRIRMMAMYETPTETHLFPAQLHPPFVPDVWVDTSSTLERKLEAWACYGSQHQLGQTPRSPEAIRAQAIARGAEIGAEAAEAFVLLRLRI